MPFQTKLKKLIEELDAKGAVALIKSELSDQKSASELAGWNLVEKLLIKRAGEEALNKLEKQIFEKYIADMEKIDAAENEMKRAALKNSI